MRRPRAAAAMDYVAERGVTAVHHMGTWADSKSSTRARQGERAADAHLRWCRFQWERLRDVWRSRETAARRPRRRLAAHRRAEGFRRRLARLAHGGVSRAVQRRAERSRAAGQHGGRSRRWISGADKAGLQVSSMRSATARSRCSSTFRARGAQKTARATGASASSTRSTSRRATSRASRSSASSRACSRITRSTTAAGRRGHRRAQQTTYAFRSLLDAGARWRLAATGSSRRRRRSKAFTRP